MNWQKRNFENKNLNGVLNILLDITEERISELEDGSIEIIQSEGQKFLLLLLFYIIKSLKTLEQ